jgi:hypothetical protein
VAEEVHQLQAQMELEVMVVAERDKVLLLEQQVLLEH